MDSEDRDHFKTIATASPPSSSGSRAKPRTETSLSRHDPAYCLKQAQLIAGCYRRDEATNPETFAAALALVLGEFPRAVVDYVSDPRTGVSVAFPMGLPNIGQIRQLCEDTERRQAIMAQPRRQAVAWEPPPLQAGCIDANEWQRLVDAKKISSKIVSEWDLARKAAPPRSSQTAAEAAITTELIIRANQLFFEAECRAHGLAPAEQTISPSLARVLREQGFMRGM